MATESYFQKKKKKKDTLLCSGGLSESGSQNGLGWKRLLKITQFQLSYRGQGHFPPDQVAQSPIHPGLEEPNTGEEPCRHQQAGLQMEKQSYLSEKTRQVSQCSSCSACIFGISSHSCSWIILMKLYPQIRVEHLMDLFIVVRSCWAGALHARKIQCEEKEPEKQARKLGYFPQSTYAAVQKHFLCIPPPTHSPAVTGSYYNGTCGWTLRDRGLGSA